MKDLNIWRPGGKGGGGHYVKLSDLVEDNWGKPPPQPIRHPEPPDPSSVHLVATIFVVLGLLVLVAIARGMGWL